MNIALSNFILHLSPNRKIIYFILRLLVIYLTLKYLFIGYVGLTDERGDYYSSLLAQYSLIDLVLQANIIPIKYILEGLGFETYVSHNIVAIVNGAGVSIAFPCLGIMMMISWVSLILAYPAKGKKILFLVLGVFFIHLINIGRIMAIILLKQNNLGSIDHHALFNTVALIAISIMFFIWLKYFTEPSGLTS